MKTTDNNGGFKLTDNNETYNIEDLNRIANINIKDIKQDEYPNLLVFPRDWSINKDDIGSSRIFDIRGNKLFTGNIMGFIGLNKTNIAITSRFTSQEEDDDNFLYYMLEKVMGINVVNLHYTGTNNDILDFLIFLFPHFLNKAMSQGLYKEYKRNEYNDANIRGAINVNRHIRLNIPFTGKIAYSTREYSYDNPVLQLIRHTVEYIKTHKFNSVLTGNSDLISNINQLMLSTSEYNKNNRQKIININKKKPVVHPYFIEYKALQRLCIRILTNEKISTGKENEKIHGILFDGAWLWEEYLNTILKELAFEHSENKTGKGAYYLFKDDSVKIYPDFLNKRDKIIADAKYKNIENGNNSDYFQIISYMYRFDCKKGCLILPYSGEEPIKKEEKSIIKGEYPNSESKIYILGMKIPQKIKDYKQFKEEISKSEKELTSTINSYKKQAILSEVSHHVTV